VELRKRAAEAVAWLPISAFSDERLYDFGFAWDPEPFVRKIWNDVLSARRQREWANKYVDSIVSAAADDNQSIVDAYRYGRALAKIGDDDSVRRIEAVLPTQAFRPNARHWLRKIASEIKMNWKKVTDKWPEPWAHEQGMIEELNGAIVMRNGTPVNAKLSLWCRVRSGPSDLGAWGGVAEDVDRVFPFHFETGEVEIQIPGRPPARATVFESHWSSRSRARLVLHGSSPYPAKLHAQQTESEKSLVDTVAEIVRETPVDGTIGDAEQVILRLQPLLKRVGMSVFSLPPEYDTGLRVKAACQEAALVVRTIAEALPRTFLSSVALWRIANAILEAESLALRLTPAELVTFGTTARLGDRESPDELLFWMMDRVESERSKDPTRQRHASKSS
jgi:hypothetical protein